MSLLRMLALLTTLVAPLPKPPTAPVLLHTMDGHKSVVRGIDFSPDGQSIATVGDDGQLRLWDLATGKPGPQAKVPNGIGSVQYSRDGKLLVTAGTDKVVRLHDATTAKEVMAFTGHTGALYVAAFTPDGQTVVSVGLDPICRIWNVKTGQQTRTMRSGNCYALALSPDGKFVVTANERQALTLWDLATGKEVRQMAGHTGVVVWLAFSPDGRTIASASYDGTVRLWETGTGKERLRLPRFQNSPRVLMFTGDGRHLAIGNYDGTARLYDTGTAKELFNDKSLAQSLYGVAISRDGRHLAGGASGRVRVWDISAITSKRPETVTLTKEAFDGHWNDLGSDDASEAYKAIVALAAAEPLKHLHGKFAPTKPLDDAARKRAAQLLKVLDDEDDDKRKKAMDELAGHGPAIVPMLKDALEKEADADVKLRLIIVLRRADVVGSEEMRTLRVVEALERAGTADAAKVLAQIAKGERGKTAAAEAKAALERRRQGEK